MIHDSFMSRANSIVIPGGRMDLAMQLVLTPMIMQLMERSRRAGGPRKTVQAVQKTA
jgi:phosphoribulokinase